MVYTSKEAIRRIREEYVALGYSKQSAHQHKLQHIKSVIAKAYSIPFSKNVSHVDFAESLPPELPKRRQTKIIGLQTHKRRIVEFVPPEELPQEQDIRNFYKSWKWKRIRYETLLESNRRCQCCNSSAEVDGVTLVVDHIKPVRYFWSLRMEKKNLQVLCNDCNMGKGSWDNTSFL